MTLGPAALACLLPLHHHPRLNGNTGVSFFPRISGRSSPACFWHGPLSQQAENILMFLVQSRRENTWSCVQLHGSVPHCYLGPATCKAPASGSASAGIPRVCNSNGQHQIKGREWRPTELALANVLFYFKWVGGASPKCAFLVQQLK